MSENQLFETAKQLLVKYGVPKHLIRQSGVEALVGLFSFQWKRTRLEGWGPQPDYPRDITFYGYVRDRRDLMKVFAMVK
jgi:hypothetical protein